MKFNRIFPVVLAISLFILPACFHDNEDKIDYNQWRDLNTKAFNDSMMLVDKEGNLEYISYSPNWDPSFSVLLKWHNDRSENKDKVSPLSTSTCHVKYTLTNISGTRLDSSANMVCIPNQMITGFMAALTQMNVKDTVTVVIPYTAGYGASGYGGVPPYTTLIFGIRLDSISRLM